ncbi:MAG: ABC transporter ATP-binding protein [Candidatus Cloacimonetes bacterium]|nr:ABC transporter ATP-binding protein [Candidatus Cloacimonadota bacterium]
MYLLEARNIKKSYAEARGKLEILKGLHLQINQGETVVITGESGTGKSTLLHLLGMLDQCDSGTILFNGRPISLKDRNISRFRNKSIGFVFQFHYLLEDFTAEENIAMPMFIATAELNKSLQAARDLLQQLDLYERRSHFPSQLSGGEQQRVAVARALINDPEIVLADEPTGNLDINHSKELIDLIIALNKSKGQTFLIVTHNLDIAARMKRHLILANGILHLKK